MQIKIRLKTDMRNILAINDKNKKLSNNCQNGYIYHRTSFGGHYQPPSSATTEGRKGREQKTAMFSVTRTTHYY